MGVRGSWKLGRGAVWGLGSENWVQRGVPNSWLCDLKRVTCL